MRTIFKYEIELGGGTETILLIPKGFEIIHVGLDPVGKPGLWAVVNTWNKSEDARFFVVGTGQLMPDVNCKHVGSFQQRHFMWHVFIALDELSKPV